MKTSLNTSVNYTLCIKLLEKHISNVNQIKPTSFHHIYFKDNYSVLPIDVSVRHALVGAKVILHYMVDDDFVSCYMDSFS